MEIQRHILTFSQVPYLIRKNISYQKSNLLNIYWMHFPLSKTVTHPEEAKSKHAQFVDFRKTVIKSKQKNFFKPW